MKKIALIRRGRLGDLLCLYPLVCYLKKHYVAEITLFVEQSNYALATYLPLIDHVVVFKEGFKYWQVLKKACVYRKYFDIAISGKTSSMKLINLFLGLLKPKQSYAYVDGKWHDRFVTHPRVLQEYQEHQALKNIKVFDPDFKEKLSSFYPYIDLKRQHNHKLCLLVSISSNRKTAILDAQAYSFLINKLSRIFDLHVIISVVPQEVKKAETLSRLLECPYEISSTFDFDLFIETLNRADVALTSEGGCSHIMAALNRYQVTLFSKVYPEIWGPLSDKVICFYDEENANHINRFDIYEALKNQCQKAL